MFDGQKNNIVKEAHEGKMLKWLKRYPSNLLMFHHRTPTSTINVKQAAHPFSTKDYFGDTEYIFIHNGYIWNADDLFEDHCELGINYQSLLPDLTFNDSEALMWDFALYMEGQQEELEARGAIAFICVKMVKGELTNLYFDRNTNPLKFKRKRNTIFLSSEGKGQMTKAGVLYNYDYKTQKIDMSPLELQNYSYKPKPYEQSHTPYQAPNWGDNRWDHTYKSHLPGPERVPVATSAPALTVMPNSNTLREVIQKKKQSQLSVIEYQDRGDGVMAPVEIEAPDVVGAARQAEELVLRYLIVHKGFFEKAYINMEDDYLEWVDKPETLERKVRLAKLEAGLEFISNDPENVDENSVSSVWEALWEQKKRTLQKA